MIHNHHRKRRPHCTEEEYDAPWNKIGLPDPLHDWVHANPEEAYSCGLLVKSFDDPKEVQVSIPEELLKKPRAKRERSREKPRNRVNVQFRVPQDEREDGAGLFDEYVDRGKELLSEELGWDENVPTYNVTMALMAKGIEAVEIELAYGEERS